MLPSLQPHYLYKIRFDTKVIGSKTSYHGGVEDIVPRVKKSVWKPGKSKRLLPVAWVWKGQVSVAHTLMLAEFTDICVRRKYLQTGKNKLTASSLYRSWFFLNASRDKEQKRLAFLGFSRSFCLWVCWGPVKELWLWRQILKMSMWFLSITLTKNDPEKEWKRNQWQLLRKCF